ncbi:MAG: Hpt domain-containing protein [Magnetovibrio sp.]|nr:Hpt domain-containing protein [Magnetovibrio sp.]
MSDQDVEVILARLRQEFIETARDQLDEIEMYLDWLESGRDIGEEELFGVQRSIHNIKGQGSTFGFPLVGRIAHLSEDYLKNTGGVQLDTVKDLRVFVDTMMEILMTGDEAGFPDTDDLLRGLPSGKPQGFSGQETHNVNVLLLMPSGVVQKTIASEMLSCGFNVSRAINSMEGLSHALDIVPDIIISDLETMPFNGIEFARVCSSIDRLKDVHFVLFTAYASGDEHLTHMPKNVEVLTKTKDYAKNLTDMLIEWGVFGAV